MANVEVDEAYKLKKKNNNGTVYTFYWWVGFKFATIFKLLGISPNQVSVLSLIFYIISGYFFYKSGLMMDVLGAICFYLGVQMDATDGKLARMTNKTSKMGIWLDYNFDYLKPAFIYPAIALNAFNESGQIGWVVIAFVALAAVYTFTIVSMRWDMFDFANDFKDEYVEKSKYHKYLKEFYFFEGIEPLVAILFGAFGYIQYYLFLWTLWLVAMYFGSTFFWGKQILKRDIHDKQTQSQ
jgi:phosphatidylglycerophosphate synthase